MPANVETAAYYKEPAWHRIGTVVQQAMNSKDCLKLSKTNWKVNAEPIYLKNGKAIKGRVANVRSSDGAVLGIVSDHYKIVQNEDAFSFIDSLLKVKDAPVTFESAGSLDGGKRVWILAHLPPMLVLGDDIVPYLVFANSHDGSSCVTVAMTPTRVVCQNTLTLALREAKRSWSIKHIGDIKGKQADAAATLRLASSYMLAMEKEAEMLQQKRITPKMLNDIVEMVFPVDEKKDSERQVTNTNLLRNQFIDIYSEASDLKAFRGSAWGVYNAFGDFASHIQPIRKTVTYNERLFASFIDGNKILKKAQDAIKVVTA